MSRNILFIKTSSLGDVVHHMPAVTDLRRRMPDAHIAWVVEEAFAPLVRLHPAVDEVRPVAWRRWRQGMARAAVWREMADFVGGLRQTAYDCIVDSQGLLRSAAMARLARGPRHGYAWDSIREPLASLFYQTRHRVRRDQHAIARNRILTGRALGYAPDADIDYGLPPAERPAPERHAVLLHATAQPGKQWPEAHWVVVGRDLIARGLVPVLPWGTSAERARSERIAAALGAAQVPERRPLDDMARLIGGARLVVGVDTGLLHLAAAYAVPLVAIFVDSDPGLTGPMGAGAIEITGARAAAPAPEHVLRAIARVLGD